MAGCPSCSSIADGFNGVVVHLANHDVTLCAVSRAPLTKLQAYKKRMGWSFPGRHHPTATSISISRRRTLRSSNRSEPANTTSPRATCGRCWRPATRVPGLPSSHQAVGRTRQRTCGIARRKRVRVEDGVVYHTYSAYARGVDGLWGMYQWSTARHAGETRTSRAPLAPATRRIRKTLRGRGGISGSILNCAMVATVNHFANGLFALSDWVRDDRVMFVAVPVVF